jgi:PPE-repeat protein
MEFIALPPEVTSALIESGPGAESFVEASGAWQRVGSNLEDTIVIYGEVLSSLTGAWYGPSSAAMAQAVAPYLTWLGATAQQCQQTAYSAQAAAGAFDSARAAVVPVSVVTANRTRLAQLLATNRFGSNLPAIAETEDEYQSMWANNSAVMNRYEAASAQAATLPQFSLPPSITSPTGVGAQASAATTAAAATPADQVSDTLSQIVSLIGFPDPTAGYWGLANTYANQFISSGFPINMLSYLAQNTQAQAFQGLGDIGAGL